MKKFLRWLQYVYVIYALLWFVVLMLLVLPFTVIALCLGKIKGGNFMYKVCNIWARSWYGLVGIRHGEIYEAPHNREGKYIFVANHSSYMDIPPVVRAIHQPVRVLGKYEMTRYPIFGIIYRMAAVVVDRSSLEKRARSVRALKSALQKHISIFIFPEGTFNETQEPLKDFYDGAFRIAIETQTPIKPLLFIDSVKRLHWRSIFSLTPGPCRVVFMQEIPVEGLTQKNLPELKKQVHSAMENGLKKYAATVQTYSSMQ
ncbi:lysophospholipid acyltransferase family protein [Danxiaibacter flavus]|uniref:Lysophospholipid acyltransferase family protein n=1 Tax=Danxiaibacter flavus TaxID=3049108 RepID=A0ABV3ZBR7_9BACT|nr:lysophospholipid acyltransferase family protein [Chitinophagaceae bacterium DXS]